MCIHPKLVAEAPDAVARGVLDVTRLPASSQPPSAEFLLDPLAANPHVVGHSFAVNSKARGQRRRGNYRVAYEIHEAKHALSYASCTH